MLLTPAPAPAKSPAPAPAKSPAPAPAETPAPARDDGSSTVEFTLVSTLLVSLFLLVMQVGFVLHTRNVLVASAQDGARYGANADRGPDQAEARTREVVASALSSSTADRMTYSAQEVARDGVLTMEVTVRGPLPLVFVPAGPMRITMQGHALEERQ